MKTPVLRGDLYRAEGEDDRARTVWHRALDLAETLDNALYVESLHDLLEELTRRKPG